MGSSRRYVPIPIHANRFPLSNTTTQLPGWVGAAGGPPGSEPPEPTRVPLGAAVHVQHAGLEGGDWAPEDARRAPLGREAGRPAGLPPGTKVWGDPLPLYKTNTSYLLLKTTEY